MNINLFPTVNFKKTHAVLSSCQECRWKMYLTLLWILSADTLDFLHKHYIQSTNPYPFPSLLNIYMFFNQFTWLF